MYTDVIIIGGGASGLLCALTIKDSLKVTIVEPNQLGKKLLVTGNGRCNMTNIDCKAKIDKYNLNLDKYLNEFDCNDTRLLFEKLGLLTYSDEQGRVYPISNTATSVQDILNITLANHKNVSHLRQFATSVQTKDKNYIITTSTGDEIQCKVCVIACGGNARIKLPFEAPTFTPALCALTTSSNEGLEGLRVDPVNVTLFDNQHPLYTESGEILFKASGISGIVILNISNHLPTNLNNTKLVLDLLPQYTETQLLNILKTRNKSLKINQLLIGIMHKVLSSNILSKSKLDFNKKVGTLNDKDFEKIVNIIKQYSLTIIGRQSNNQIFAGGVSLTDLDLHLQHKKHPNLYILGEYTEVIGACGGYNLQWAFTSGVISGRNINK